MLGKRLIYKRGVMIAIAVIALMTLTAGVAAAASAKAKFEADGIVGSVGLAPGGTVESEFKIAKNGRIKNVTIGTVGEAFGGVITNVDPCEEKGKHSEGACDAVDIALLGGTVISVHESTAKLKVIGDPFPNPAFGPEAEFIAGTLKGNLVATMGVESSDDSQFLSGTGKLRVRSTEGTVSVYGCLLTLILPNPADPENLIPVFADLDYCISNPGPNPLTVTVTPATQADWLVSPVMIPVDLHVTDTGKFEVSDDSMSLKGKIKVVVDSTLGGATTGTIEIDKGVAKLVHDHDEKPKKGKKSKKGDDD